MSSQVISSKSSVKASKKSESRAAASVTDPDGFGTVKATGRWTRDEHYRFLEALKLYGKEWKRVQQHVCTRSST